MKIEIIPEIIFPNKELISKDKLSLEDFIDESIVERVRSADLNILNLECVLTTKEDRIEKWGSSLKADISYIEYLKLIPNLIVNLSNNHILDYGPESLEEMLSLFDANGIRYVGVTLYGSCEYAEAIIESNGEKLGIYSCCEHEFSRFEGTGAVLFDPMRSILDVQRMARNCDMVIVLHHGGIEFYPYPFPLQQSNMRCFADAGADVVVCQHNHCVSCKEEYNGSTIIYGQGTLSWSGRAEIIDNISDFDMMNSGMLISFDTQDGQIKETFFGTGNVQAVADGYLSRSDEIKDSRSVAENFEKYCLDRVEHARIFGDVFYDTSFLAELKKAIKHPFKSERQKRADILKVYDYLNCESHYAILKTISEMKRKNK